MNYNELKTAAEILALGDLFEFNKEYTAREYKKRAKNSPYLPKTWNNETSRYGLGMWDIVKEEEFTFTKTEYTVVPNDYLLGCALEEYKRYKESGLDWLNPDYGFHYFGFFFKGNPTKCELPTKRTSKPVDTYVKVINSKSEEIKGVRFYCKLSAFVKKEYERYLPQRKKINEGVALFEEKKRIEKELAKLNLL